MNPTSADEQLASRLNLLTERVIGCAFTVGGVLGAGFLERVYENALAHEIRKAGLRVEQQRRLIVRYDTVEVGEYVADMVVEDLLLIEVKAARALEAAHEAQCLNYLTATRLPLCLLFNFGPRVQIRRVVGRHAPQFPIASPGSPRLVVTPETSSTPMTWAERAELGK
ncbi:MAG TPA: GxxExxY protein [Phycisphaerales bacterium]|nr:GxxExxY protein [Phycisphaerales bacterium]